MVEVLIQCMEWNMAVDLLDILQENLPDKTGEKGKWNFEIGRASCRERVCLYV